MSKGLPVLRIRMSLISLLWVLTSLFFGSPAWADSPPQAPVPIVRTTVTPNAPITVGQQVQLNVDLLVETWFTKAPQVPKINVKNAIALQPPNSSVNFSERINGKTYSGQRRTYFIFPQRPGRYDLPSLDFTLFPAQPGQPAEPVMVSSEPLQFRALLPSALAEQKLNYAISTSKLTLETNFDKDLEPLQVGDAFKQTVTLTAKDLLAGELPSLNLMDFEGLTVYPDPPKLLNQYDRGALTGKRSESITYIVEQPGRYALPETQIFWWNTQSQSLETETIPGITIRIRPTLKQRLVQLAPWLLLLAGLGFLLWYFRDRINRAISDYKKRQDESEKAYFNRFYQACQTDDPMSVYNALLSWLAHPDIDAPSLEVFTAQVDNATLSQRVSELEGVLFNKAGQANPTISAIWSGKVLYQEIADARKIWLQQQSKYASDLSSLPTLNPRASYTQVP